MAAPIPKKVWLYGGPVVFLAMLLVSTFGMRTAAKAQTNTQGAKGSLPRGSLVLMADRLSLGVTAHVEPVRTSFSLRDSEPAVGRNFMRLSLYPKKASTLTLDFVKAWRSSGIPYPGDMGQFLGGALVFYIRTHTPGEQFELGFAMAEEKNEQSDQLPVRRNSSLPITLYCWTGPEWQKVIIPLDHFARQGYIWVVPQASGRDGSLVKPLGPGMAIGRPMRVARPFNWRQVVAMTIRGMKVKRPNRLIDLDHVALVPSYDKDEMKRLMLEASRKELMARRAKDYVIFDDEADGVFWSWPGGLYTYVNLDEVIYKEGKKSAHFVMQSYQSISYSSSQANAEIDTTDTEVGSDAGSPDQQGPQGSDVEVTYAMTGISMPDIDLSGIFRNGGVSFWVRGKNGGEHFEIGLSCIKDFIYEANLVGPDTRAYIEMKVKWQRVIVPLVDFPRTAQYTDESRVGRRTDFKWDRVTNIFFIASPPDEAEWQWYIDDLRFIPRVPRKLTRRFPGDPSTKIL